MVEDLTDFEVVHLEVSVHEVHEADDGEHQDHYWVVCLALGLKWIVSHFVTEWLIADPWLILVLVASCEGSTHVDVAVNKESRKSTEGQSSSMAKTYLVSFLSFWNSNWFSKACVMFPVLLSYVNAIIFLSTGAMNL
jgi:hypothetical protein